MFEISTIYDEVLFINPAHITTLGEEYSSSVGKYTTIKLLTGDKIACKIPPITLSNLIKEAQ